MSPTEMTITLAGGNRVLAEFDGLTLATDQDGSAPSPFQLFLASLGTCAGFYIANFCTSRGLPLDGISIRQRMEPDEGGKRIGRVLIDVTLPPDFPEPSREPLLRAARSCTVKKHLEQAPAVEVRFVPARTA
jgi:ribosomal protein S12 methylthiotransferase accessory factor